MESIISKVCEEKLRGIVLKEEQKTAVESLLAGKDVLAVLPTGFGKSLIFQVFVEARAIVLHREVSVLVISPLVSVVQDQILEAESLGITCRALKDVTFKDSTTCTPQLIFASAEEVKGKAFQQILKDPKSSLNISLELIVVDESHTVETWTGER
jgi:superfamily II DNA helicase RecQ